MENPKQTTKTNRTHLIIWLVFLCFLLIFTINSFTYAQYLSSNDTFNTARLARFYVNSPNTNNISLDFNTDLTQLQTIPFEIVNFNENVTNEVLLEYSIQVVSVYNNLPLQYQLNCTSINEGNNIANENIFYASGHEWIGGVLLPSTPCTHNYTLTVKWQDGQYQADSFSNEIDLIRITIDSKQIN